MTRVDARKVTAGTKIRHNHIHGLVAIATGPAQIEGLKWRIPVDVETCTEIDGVHYITGLKGYCWTVEG